MVMCLVDLKKAFDVIPCNRLLHNLQTRIWGRSGHTRIYQAHTHEHKRSGSGRQRLFQYNYGRELGVPLSLLLFSLCFDRVINYLQQHIPASKAIQIANLVVKTALYADDVIILTP